MAKKTAKKKATDETAENQKSFEDLMDRLDQIVEQLEEGELPLERSIELFEEGMGIAKRGVTRLDDAERKVNLLLRDGEQEQQVPFDPDESEND